MWRYSNSWMGFSETGTYGTSFEDVFLLKRMRFEGGEFWAPNHEERLLNAEYVDFMPFSYDMGAFHSGAWVE